MKNRFIKRPAQKQLDRMMIALRQKLTEHLGKDRAEELMNSPEKIEAAVNSIAEDKLLSELVNSIYPKVKVSE